MQSKTHCRGQVIKGCLQGLHFPQKGKEMLPQLGKARRANPRKKAWKAASGKIEAQAQMKPDIILQPRSSKT